MSDLSHVSLEEKLCPVCRETHATGVLIDKRLRQVLPQSVVTGLQLCPRHMKVAQDEDRIWLCEADPAKSKDGSIYFLAGIAAIRRHVLDEMFENNGGNAVDENIIRLRFVLVNHAFFSMITSISGAELVPDDHPTLNPPRKGH